MPAVTTEYDSRHDESKAAEAVGLCFGGFPGELLVGEPVTRLYGVVAVIVGDAWPPVCGAFGSFGKPTWPASRVTCR